MTTALLPSLPKGKEFEEFLAAFFQTNGYYVERNIIDRQEEEITVMGYLHHVTQRGCLN
jgi:hypothetical protein